jgi:hypothetical protein
VILTRFRRPKRTATLQINQGRIPRHINPLIGNFRLADLNRTVVRQFINDITFGKTATDLHTRVRGELSLKEVLELPLALLTSS